MSQEMRNPFTELPRWQQVVSEKMRSPLGEVGAGLFRDLKRKAGSVRPIPEDELKIAISAKERALAMESRLETGEFFLGLPSDRVSPTLDELLLPKPVGYGMRQVRFDQLAKRPYADLVFTEDVLDNAKITHPVLRAKLLALDQSPEKPVVAKVFSLEELIGMDEVGLDPVVDCYTIEELLEAIDLLGYRPATLKELLAYEKGYWEPERHVDPEKDISTYVVALGTFILRDDAYSPAVLRHDSEGRQLRVGRYDRGMYRDQCLLVIRK